jgi:hypothetical protein
VSAPVNLLLEFADSEVARVQQVGDQLHIHFAAAAVVEMDAAGKPGRAGYARAVVLVLFEAAGALLPAPLMGRIAQGRLSIAGRWLASLPLPHREAAPVQLELRFAQWGEWSVVARGVECRFADGPNFSEALSC